MVVMEVMMDIIGKSEKIQDESFISEFANGYLNIEIVEKEDLINEFTEEYQNMEDKDSFKGQYLESWIDVLKTEVKEIKKLLKN